MKYIVMRDLSARVIGTAAWPEGGQVSDGSGRDMVMIFAEGLTHSVVFEQLKAVYPALVAVSAGFCDNSEDGWYCHGKSTSLRLEPLPGDEGIIHQSLWVEL